MSKLSAAQCQYFMFDSISGLSNLIFNIIGLARTSQKLTKYPSRVNKVAFLWAIFELDIGF